MKKELLKIVLLLFVTTGILMSCSDNDSDESQVVRVLESNGVFVVSSGNSDNSINGSVTYYDYSSQTASSLGSFSTVGGSFDRHSCDAVVYGNKLYVTVTTENTIYVSDVKSGQTLATLSTTALMGENNGLGPRRITAALGNIYVSTQGGYVAAIDTASYQLTKTYQAGSDPEGMCIANGKLYVANSNNGQQQSSSISVIDLTTGANTSYFDTNIRNPQEIAVIGDAIYYLDLGTVDELGGMQTDNGVYCIEGDSIRKIMDATAMAVGTSKDYEGNTSVCIYSYNLPQGYSNADYVAYSLSLHQTWYYLFDAVDNPCGIGIDPLTSQVFIASTYVKTGKYAWDRVPDYTSPGYVAVFDENGVEQKRFDCGVNPVHFAFNVGVRQVEI